MLCKCLQGSLQDSLCIGLWWYIMCRYTLSMFLTCSRVHSNIYKCLQGSLQDSLCIGLWWYIMCRYTLSTVLTCSRVHEVWPYTLNISEIAIPASAKAFCRDAPLPSLKRRHLASSSALILCGQTLVSCLCSQRQRKREPISQTMASSMVSSISKSRVITWLSLTPGLVGAHKSDQLSWDSLVAGAGQPMRWILTVLKSILPW